MVTTDDRLKGIAPDDGTETRYSTHDALDEQECRLLHLTPAVSVGEPASGEQ